MSNLASQTATRIKSLCAQGYEHYDTQDYKGALRVFYQAWLEVPKPQTDWIEAGWVLTAIGDTYFRLNQFHQAREALNSALHCPQAEGNPFIHLRLGQSLLEQGDIGNARRELHRAYNVGGTAIFEREPEKYLAAIRDVVTQ
ncbi:tetratricopeptide repeat protein [Exilibacterium tricleocarpae]|uniref:Tetratricopeptide repeat protein n=1 Tax=Exilibacterium tricleocarpae TaxID=2591008 RepID=A0A545T8A2_9GAMM|nr:tetratricopeptide repeat protein [Exilibacterium tricleocarpae]TQV73450.1 tetratricopeptide repeat protein [Exilibacterium tricleocarpae]